MDDIIELLDEAASHLQPFTFDVDALIGRTRLVRRRRRTLQVASSSLGVVAVLGVSFGAAATLGAHHPTVPAVATSTRSTRLPVLPEGFAQACSKPGTKLLVRIVPVTIPHRICDLSGVEIDRPGEVTAVVPPRGQNVAVMPAGAAARHLAGLQISTDKKTGDVTISTP